MDLHKEVLKAKQGDKEAFGLIFDEYSEKLYRYICFRISDRTQAEDILQDVFLKAWKALPKLSMENLNFSAWLYRIASNTANDHFRKVYRSPKTEPLENAESFLAENENIEASIDASKMLECMEELPLAYRQVLELRFIQDFDINSTARIMGKTNIAVRLAQHRALKALRGILKDKYGESYDIQ